MVRSKLASGSARLSEMEGRGCASAHVFAFGGMGNEVACDQPVRSSVDRDIVVTHFMRHATKGCERGMNEGMMAAWKYA